MKKILLLTAGFLFSAALFAQGNSGNKGKSKNNPAATQTDQQGNSGETGKGKDKDKDKDKQHPSDKGKDDKAVNDAHDRKIWEGVGDENCNKPSKNQPAKVRAAFQRDYPNAFNVRWTKCRGDWTATFSGGLFRSTAVYHANGDRKDTRMVVPRENIPRRILDVILKRRPDTRLDEAIRIEVPGVLKEIFRIRNEAAGRTDFEYYDANGVKVEYNY